MRGAVRLSALMKLPVIWVWTHDSIGLGEDGPTHQPIEQLAQLRATPNICVVRPADFNETALAWRFALRREDGPTCFALSRQNLPILDPDAIPDDAIERGAYVLRDCEGEPDLVLIGTGSEVSLCLETADALDDLAVRVVSMPCMDTFAEQDDDYRDSVIPRSVPARVAVEAASILPWHRWVGEQGDVVGMTTFGASAPYKDLYAHFGFVPAVVAERCRAVIERVGAARR
jgi:transketolase